MSDSGSGSGSGSGSEDSCSSPMMCAAAMRLVSRSVLGRVGCLRMKSALLYTKWHTLSLSEIAEQR